MESPVELDELMQRIRAVVQATHRGAGQAVPPAARPLMPESIITPPRPAAPAPDGTNSTELELALAEAASILPRARQKNDVTGVPKVLRPLYRNQGGFNGTLLAAVERVVDAGRRLQVQNSRLQNRLDGLESALAQQHDWTASLFSAQARQVEWMTALEASLFETGGWAPHSKSLRVKAGESAASPIDGQEAGIPDQTTVEKIQSQLDSVDDHANRLGDHLKNLQAQVDDHSERYANWHAHYRQTTAHHDLLDQMVRRLEDRQRSDASYLKNQLWFLQRLIQPLLAGKDASAGNILQPPVAEHEMDALYLAFEEAMRGSRDEVMERTRVYLPYIAAAHAGTAERPVLDLGCGRGEWLEILREQDMIATGVDLNTCMIEVCNEHGLDATLANALDHLANLRDASCGAVTAFHLIEHLPFPVLIRFLRECRRVLQPGGVAIFETPNPYNVLVGSGYFYHDFTHQRPLPPTSTKFLAEQMGFSRVEVLPLHPWDESAKVHGDGDKALEWRFNELFYGPQDYALIATP